MSTQKRSDEDFARELASHLELETEQRIADGLAPDAARAAARRDFGNVTAARERFYESPARALARPPGAGRPLRRAQHAARAGGGPRRRRVARRRHRRHHRHADGPGRRLSQAAGALPRSGTALARADRQPGPPDEAARKRPARGALPHVARHVRFQHRRDHRAAGRSAICEPATAPTRPRRAPSRRSSSRSSASGPTSEKRRSSRHPAPTAPRARSSATGSGSGSSTGAPTRSGRSSGSTTSRTRSPASCPSASGSRT